MKNLKIFPNVVLDSVKAFWDTDHNAKTAALYKAPFLKKSRKTAKHWPFFNKKCILTILRQFFSDFFKNRAVYRAVVFCVAISVPKRLVWAIKNNLRNYFPIFHHKGGPLPSKKLPGVEKKVKKVFKNKTKIIRVKNGTRKWVVEVLSSQVVLLDTF